MTNIRLGGSQEDASQALRRRGRRAGMLAVSLAAHVLVVFALLAARPEVVKAPEPTPITFVIVKPEPPPEAPSTAPQGGAPKTPGPPKPKPARPAPKRSVVSAPAPKRAEKPPTPIPEGNTIAATQPSGELSDAEVAGARTAGAGSGAGDGKGSGSGRGCDMVHRLQAALRRDARVQAVVTRAHNTSGTGKTMLVWNGDWVLSSGEEGKGLAGLREAITVAVAFAPEDCRREAMRGLVLISMSDVPGSPRVALGTGAWRWSDMLFAGGPTGRTSRG